MDGTPALDLWDLVIEVFSFSTKPDEPILRSGVTGKPVPYTTLHMKNQNPTNHVNLDLNNVDHVSSNVRPSRFGAMLCVLDPKIQLRYNDTKNQVADILTKGKFTRDEWNNLLRFFNIRHLSSICCAQNFSLTSSPKTMAKRMQEQKEDWIVAKSKLTVMNLALTVSTSSSSVNHPIASKSPGILKASTGIPDARARRNSKPDAASSSRGKLKDAYLGGLMAEVAGNPAATVKSQE